MDTGHDRDGDSSETEVQQSLQVAFSDGNAHRRKSSLVKTESALVEKSLAHTSCFLHFMLERRDSPTIKEQLTLEDLPSSPARGTGKGPRTLEDGYVESRLLTKKQLSDVALGIRELSKKLTRLRLKLRVRNVFLLTKAYDESVIVNTKELAQWLLSLNKNGELYTVFVESVFEHNRLFDAEGIVKANPSHKDRLKYWTIDLCAKCPQTFDIVISLGGDGTMLYCSWLFQRIVPPVLSFSLGSLGFLTKFDFNRYPEILLRAMEEGISVSLRLRFEATVMRSQHRDRKSPKDLIEELIGEESDDDHTHKPEITRNILNEVVVDRGPNPTMAQLEIFGDDEHFTTMQADGVCIATPTGSTAYNLAAGGSLCHPENPVILLTAICAHTLTFRPLLLPDTMVLRVGVPYDARSSSWVSFDGRERLELHPGDYVTISASRYPFPYVLSLDKRGEDWIDSISRTLNWNSRQRQKALKKTT